MLPGGEMRGRPLHLIWVIDCSSSMKGPKIQTVNNAIREVIPDLRRFAQSNPHANVLVRALKYATDAQWHIAHSTPIDHFLWTDVMSETRGVSNAGRALLQLTEELKMPPMEPRMLPPMLILVSGSPSTDRVGVGIKALLDQPWGKKAVRLAVGIGGDADYDMLQRFIDNPEIQPLRATNMEAIIDYIKIESEPVLTPSSPNANLSFIVDLPVPKYIYTSKIKIFFSYAHKDEPYLKILQKHLSQLKHLGFIDIWYDRNISAGTDWKQDISKHMNEAQIILLLVSPDFMDSDYCYSIEMKRALEMHKAGLARVIPVILHPVLFAKTPIGELQVLPSRSKPITRWHPIDDAFVNVAQGIEKVVEELRSKSLNQFNSDDVW